MADRFREVDDTEIESLRQKTKNKNTTTSTLNWVRVFQSWARNQKTEEKIERYSVAELNVVLRRFYAEVRKQNGDNYEPDSLAVMQASLDRYLKENEYPKSIIKDKEFASSKEVLEGKARLLRENGLGKKPHASRSLTKQEEEALWECKELGGDNARALQNTLWFLLSQSFGLRGRQEHHTLRIEHFNFLKADNGTEYISFVEEVTKTRQGSLHKKPRLVQPKMFANGNERCPVLLFRKFISKRPPSLKITGLFYLTPICNPTNENVWYKTVPLGIHSVVGKSTLSAKRQLTNHSARKTIVKKLKAAGFEKSEIIDVTGHSSTHGLNSYHEGDEVQQQSIFNAISNVNDNNQQAPRVSDSRVSSFDFGVFPRNAQQQNTRSFNFFNCNVTLNAGGSISSSQH